uniref:AlkB homolog 1, histone H2A dioxygenase n=1 Tax=Neolamprologus brichardi TaxID=32507 RepID=A0A3Q4H1Z6_NEOBR
MAKMAASMVEGGEDSFRKIFKFYRRRNPPPDLSDVIDFSRCAPGEQVRAKRAPGFIFISDPFLRGTQPFWLRQCLKIYPQKPNICNLDMHMSPLETQDVWGQSEGFVFMRVQTKPRSLCFLFYARKSNSSTYSPSSHTPFPRDLHLLSAHMTAACGFPGFISEAGILNYYRSDSSLGIHVDESELDRTRPLLSFSFGQSAIFLLGGPRRQDPPTAMLMHSGDVMVMSGPSRLLYHAVPRILPAPPGRLALETGGCIQTPPPQEGSVVEPVSEEEWAVCSRYIQSSRVNVTVRQVLAPGQNFPETPRSHQTTDSGQTDGYDDGESGKRKRSSSDSPYAAETH